MQFVPIGLDLSLSLIVWCFHEYEPLQHPSSWHDYPTLDRWALLPIYRPPHVAEVFLSFEQEEFDGTGSTHSDSEERPAE